MGWNIATEKHGQLWKLMHIASNWIFERSNAYITRLDTLSYHIWTVKRDWVHYISPILLNLAKSVIFFWSTAHSWSKILKAYNVAYDVGHSILVSKSLIRSGLLTVSTLKSAKSDWFGQKQQISTVKPQIFARVLFSLFLLIEI